MPPHSDQFLVRVWLADQPVSCGFGSGLECYCDQNGGVHIAKRGSQGENHADVVPEHPALVVGRPVRLRFGTPVGHRGEFFVFWDIAEHGHTENAQNVGQASKNYCF